MIAMDAAEARLVEAWMAAGVLPNLRKLRAAGIFGRLKSSADWLSGSPWPTFYTGTPPDEHGLYRFLQWRPERMGFSRPAPDWLDLQPFWRRFGADGPAAVMVNIPQVYPAAPFNGVELSGWGTHDRLAAPSSYPADVLTRVRREFGPSPVAPEVHRRESMARLLALRDAWVAATERSAQIALRLMADHAWDLFGVAFGATHRCGHKLWDGSALDGPAGDDDAARLSAALRDVYVACDRAVGRLVESAGPEAVVMVFSLHGMGPNTSRVEVLPDLLRAVLGPGAGPRRSSHSRHPLHRLRAMVPQAWRTEVKRRLPFRLQDRLSRFWLAHGRDWKATEAFSLSADLQGYIRLNKRGREAAGVVEEGEAVERLCARIEAGLKSFADADTGRPVVAEIARRERLFANGARADCLPDLVVQWSREPACRHRALTSPRHGTVPWPTPGFNADGRSGNHRPQGWLLAAGPQVTAGASLEGGHILDVAPTICALLGVPPLPDMRGRVLRVSTPAA